MPNHLLALAALLAAMGRVNPELVNGPAINPTGFSPCAPIGCADVSVAPPPGFDHPNPATFQPDRRPIGEVNAFGGSCFGLPSGGPDWWHDLGDDNGNGIVNAVEELLLRLQEKYDEGWRRLMVLLPAGSLPGQVFASSQWWTMPELRRDSLSVALPLWLDAHPDATLGLYIGWRINDPCRLCMDDCTTCLNCDSGDPDCNTCSECADVPPAHTPLTTDAGDMCVVHNNVRPWMDLGLQELWFDKSAGSAKSLDAILRLAGNPDYDGVVRFGAEPMANTPAPGPNIPNADAISRLPFVSTRHFYEVRELDAYTYDPATTEVHVMLRSSDFCIDENPDDSHPCTGCRQWCYGSPEGPLIDVVYEYVAKGFIPYARSTFAAEYVRRIYDMQPDTIPCPEDLDVDGDVDDEDANRLASNIGTADASLYHGDLDFDDDVDVIDYFLLVSHPGFPGGGCE